MFSTKQHNVYICKDIFPHRTHARCGETPDFSTSVMWRSWNYSTCGEMSDFSTSVMCRNLKLLHMWRNFRFLHICHAYKSEISPHDKFFSTYLICDICDKYQVCSIYEMVLIMINELGAVSNGYGMVILQKIIHYCGYIQSSTEIKLSNESEQI